MKRQCYQGPYNYRVAGLLDARERRSGGSKGRCQGLVGEAVRQGQQCSLGDYGRWKG
jgi:hypothetical protein